MESHFDGMSVSGNEISGFHHPHTRLSIGPIGLMEASIPDGLSTDLKTMFCDGKDIFDHLIKIK